MQFYPTSATKWLALLVQAELEASKLRLWQAGLLTPSIATTRTQLLAAEATYTGYPAGGVELDSNCKLDRVATDARAVYV